MRSRLQPHGHVHVTQVRDLLADPAMMRKEHVRYLPLLAPLLNTEIGEIGPNRFTVRPQLTLTLTLTLSPNPNPNPNPNPKPNQVRLQAEERQERLLELCVQLLRAKCGMHPSGVVLLLDNVQWMDEVHYSTLTSPFHHHPHHSPSPLTTHHSTLTLTTRPSP